MNPLSKGIHLESSNSFYYEYQTFDLIGVVVKHQHACKPKKMGGKLDFFITNNFKAIYDIFLKITVFTESALWADSVYKLIFPSVCL